MLKKVNLLALMVMLGSACLPASAEVVIATAKVTPTKQANLVKYYDQDPNATKMVVFDEEDIAGLTKAEIDAYLRNKTARTLANRKALAFFYNQAGRYLLDEGYEVVYFGLYGIGLENAQSTHARHVGYYAVLAMPTEIRRLEQSNETLELSDTATGGLFSLDDELLTRLDTTELAGYLAENHLNRLSEVYHKGYMLEFATEDLFEYDPLTYDHSADEDPSIIDLGNWHKDYLQELPQYQALIEAGYVLLNLELTDIHYTPQTQEVGKVGYRAIFAK